MAGIMPSMEQYSPEAGRSDNDELSVSIRLLIAKQGLDVGRKRIVDNLTPYLIALIDAEELGMADAEKEATAFSRDLGAHILEIIQSTLQISYIRKDWILSKESDRSERGRRVREERLDLLQTFAEDMSS